MIPQQLRIHNLFADSCKLGNINTYLFLIINNTPGMIFLNIFKSVILELPLQYSKSKAVWQCGLCVV